MNTEVLQELGLTINESKVYSALLEIGQSPAGAVADKSKVHRRNAYDALNRLIEKGLVTHIIKLNKKYYEAVGPEKIVDLLKEKLNIANNLLPELLSRYKKSMSKRRIEVLEGIGGMKTFFRKLVAESENIPKRERGVLLIGMTGKALTTLKYFMPQYFRQLNKNGVFVKSLANRSMVSENDFKEIKHLEFKYLPRNFNTLTQIFLFGEKSGILIWSEEPVAILITDKGITDGFKSYFNFIWKLVK